MSSEVLQQRAKPIIVVTATLFIVDLFLGWQRVSVHMPAVIDVRNTTSGWSGWGALAGLCAIVLLVLVLAGRSPRATATLSVAALLFTAIEVLAGNARVDVGASMMRVQVDTTLWPAWVGLALAGLMAAATAIASLAPPGERTPITVAPHGRT